MISLRPASGLQFEHRIQRLRERIGSIPSGVRALQLAKVMKEEGRRKNAMRLRTLALVTATMFLSMSPAPAPTAPAEEAAAVDTPVYGRNLMTAEERDQHRERMRAATTEQERTRIRSEHRKRMQARAQKRNVPLPDAAAPAGAGRSVRGRDLMTPEERKRHREEMRTKATPEEREKARKEKHEEMKERAKKKGVTLPEEPLPRGRGMGRGHAPR